MPIGGRLMRATERAIRGVAAKLPPERGDALLAAGKAGYTVMTGRRTRRGAVLRREPAVDPIAMRRAQGAMDRGDLPAALELIEGLARRYPDSTRVLALRRDVVSRMGEIR